MKNKEIMQALTQIGNGFLQLASAFEEEVASAPKKEEPKPATKPAPEEVEEEIEEIPEETPEEDEDTLNLSDLDLEDLQLIAKQMKLRGYKNLEHADLVEKLASNPEEKLMTALIELGYVSTEEDKTYKETKANLDKDMKIAKGEAIPDAPVIEEAEEEEDEEELSDSIDLEDFEEDTLKDICTELGLSTRGKKQALITRIETMEEEQIYQALVNLELIAEEDAEEEIEEEEEVEEPKAKSKGKALPKRETMTPKRAEVFKEIPEAFEEEIKAGNITYDDVFQVLEELGRIGEEEDDDDATLKEKYIELMVDLTDDDGETHEFADPYFVNDALRCCGAEVPIRKNKGTCPVCDNTYSLEEEE